MWHLSPRPRMTIAPQSQLHNYHLQTKFVKVVFTPVCQSFCSQGRRGSASVHAGIPPHPPGPGTHTHPGSRYPLAPGTPHPQEQTSLPDQAPPWDLAPSPHRSRDGYCCEHYTSYWNAFLFADSFKWHLLHEPLVLSIHLNTTFP